MKNIRISEVSAYLPERVVLNSELEDRVPLLPKGSLERLFGIRERRFAAPNEQVSDLATAAARPIVDKVGADNIEFLIFAAACADLIEPATCNIVQHKLGLKCPAMDLKNACNSFTSAVMTASSLIRAGICRNVLVVNGEKLSDAIRMDFDDAAQLTRHIAAFSLGDAGAAALVSETKAPGIVFQKFFTDGAHWPLCTIQGGGSMYPHDVSKNYFEGQTAALKDVLAEKVNSFFHQCLKEGGWSVSAIKHIFTHQVSVSSTRLISSMAQVGSAVVEETFPFYGNTAAASIPLAMYHRNQRGELQEGDPIVWLGLAAGVSISVQLMIA